MKSLDKTEIWISILASVLCFQDNHYCFYLRFCSLFQLGDNLLTTAGATDIIKNVLECEANGLELIDLGVGTIVTSIK